MQHQVPPFQRQDQGDGDGNGGGSDQIALPHPQHVAEKDVVKVDIGRESRVQHDPQREHGGKDHSHHRIAFQPAVVGEIPGQKRRAKAGDESPQKQGKPRHMGQHDAGQNGMADCVSHQSPAFQDQKARQKRTRRGHDQRDQERVLHERELEGLDQSFDHRSASRLRRRAARMPCLGAKRKAREKSVNWRRTITPPVAPSRKKLR